MEKANFGMESEQHQDSWDQVSFGLSVEERLTSMVRKAFSSLQVCLTNICIRASKSFKISFEDI